MLVVRSARSRARFITLGDSPAHEANTACEGSLSTLLEFVHEKRGSIRGTTPSKRNYRWAKPLRGGNIGEGVPLSELHLH